MAEQITPLQDGLQMTPPPYIQLAGKVMHLLLLEDHFEIFPPSPYSSCCGIAQRQQDQDAGNAYDDTLV